MSTSKRGVVAFAFAVPATVRSNVWIAEMAMSHHVPIFTQPDIQFPSNSGVSVTYIKEESGKPSPTLRIARESLRWALDNLMTELIIVAAKPHMWRVMRDMRVAAHEIGLDDMGLFPDPRVDGYLEESWFCPESTQPRTQSRKNWENRERVIRYLMPFWFYKLVAS